MKIRHFDYYMRVSLINFNSFNGPHYADSLNAFLGVYR